LSEARPSESASSEPEIDRDALPTETAERMTTVSEGEPTAAAEGVARLPAPPAPPRSGNPRPRAPL